MLEKLKEPFPPQRISWRVGSTTADKKRGLALAYIDARDVMARLDEVVGIAGWQCRYTHADSKTICEIGVKAGDEWIWKADGAGDSDFEAEKGALSDAFKRAAVRFGIGRYLYDVDSVWVEIEPAGKSFKIKETELPRLMKLLSASRLVPTNKPNGNGLLSEPNATEAATRLKEDINKCETLDELGKFIGSDNFKHRVSALPEKHRGHVRVAYKAKSDKLNEVSHVD